MYTLERWIFRCPKSWINLFFLNQSFYIKKMPLGSIWLIWSEIPRRVLGEHRGSLEKSFGFQSLHKSLHGVQIPACSSWDATCWSTAYVSLSAGADIKKLLWRLRGCGLWPQVSLKNKTFFFLKHVRAGVVWNPKKPKIFFMSKKSLENFPKSKQCFMEHQHASFISGKSGSSKGAMGS